MTAQTRLSAKGQIVIPKDVRDRLGWLQGSELEVIETTDGVILRKKATRKKLSVDEALAQIHAKVQYDGPRIPVEDLSFSPAAYREWHDRQR